MASLADDRYEDVVIVSALDHQRSNLLDVVEDKNRSLNKKNILHRMFYISHIRTDEVNRADIGSNLEKFIKNITNTPQGEPVTGLMLIYMRHIIHVLESSEDMLVNISKDLYEKETNANSDIDHSKILIVSHDIPLRLFTNWAYRVLDMQATRIEAYEPLDTNERLILDVIVQLLKLGEYLSKQPKLSAKLTLDSLHEKVPDLLPQQGALYYLLNESEGCMLSPEEYVLMHTRPFDITLEEEKTWPLATRLFPYK